MSNQTEAMALTRGQLNAIWDAIKAARNAGSDLGTVRDACDDVGLSKVVGAIDRSINDTASALDEIIRVLLDAEEREFEKAPFSNAVVKP